MIYHVTNQIIFLKQTVFSLQSVVSVDLPPIWTQQRPEANKRLNQNRCEMSMIYCLLIKLSSNALVSTTILQMNLCGPAACSVLSWNDSLIFQGKMINSCLFQLLKCEGFFSFLFYIIVTQSTSGLWASGWTKQENLWFWQLPCDILMDKTINWLSAKRKMYSLVS